MCGTFRADLPHGQLCDALRRSTHGGSHHLQRRGPCRSLGGRLLYGVLADRLGVKPVLVAGLAIQAVVIAGYLAVRQLEQFYVLAVIFGATYGGVMPLYAVLAREYFGGRIIGTVLGAATMLSSLGMAFGPLAGGMVFDAYASYSWLFIGSALVGLGAAGIAIAFPPLPRRAELQPA